MVKNLTGNYLLWGQSIDGFRTTFDGGTALKTKLYRPSHFHRRGSTNPGFGSQGAQPHVPVFPPNPVAGFPVGGYPRGGSMSMLPMKFPGTFMGMIHHIELNTLSPTLNPSMTLEFVKTINGGTVVVNTGVKILIPGGQTGFFSSNTDISEFARSWLENEFIGILLTKESPSPSTQGHGAGTLMILLDLDLPPPVIP